MKRSFKRQRLGHRAPAIAVTATVLAIASSGVSMAQPSPTPSPTPFPSATSGAAEPSIHLLNPSPAYDPHVSPTGSDLPKISDKLDADTTYHVVAWTGPVETDDVVEATIIYEGDGRLTRTKEITMGVLDRAPNLNGAWGLAWDVPPNLPEGNATVRVSLFGQTAEGFFEKATDEVAVDVEHSDSADPLDAKPAAEALEMTWPTDGGPLGFFRPRGGSWVAAVSGVASAGTNRIDLAYSVTVPGDAPKFQPCGGDVVSAAASAVPIPFTLSCRLGFNVLPSTVTAISAVAEKSVDRADTNQRYTQEAGDAHSIVAYLQDPSTMTLSFQKTISRGMAGGCVGLLLTARDEFGRPVQGANVDVHAVGPDDQLLFGSSLASGRRPPDTHSLEPGSNCAGGPVATEGVHRIPGGPDVKHQESSNGTGLSGPSSIFGPLISPGQWQFTMYSARPGVAEVTAWIDEEEITEEDQNRPIDDDTLEEGEAAATAQIQWYTTAPSLAFESPGASSPPGECQPYLVKARAGDAGLPHVNVDVHVQSEDDDVRFCTPPDASPLRAPDKGKHDPIDASQSHESESKSPTIHAEGEADDSGNLTFGLVAPTVGNAAISAWMDGERGVDNDTNEFAEPQAIASASWVDCLSGSHVSFLNPSAYGMTTLGAGNGTDVSTKPDSDGEFNVVLRSDCPDSTPTVEIQVATGQTFTTIGDATRIDGTDTYEFSWAPTLADGGYKLRAHVPGSPEDQDQTVILNRQDGSSGDPTEQADETVDLSAPSDGGVATFLHGVTRVEGIASGGAEGLDLFYAKTAAKDTPKGSDWIACGYVDLDGTGLSPQDFSGECALQGADQPLQVTAVAALAVDCGVAQEGCDASPAGTSRQLLTFKKDSGDAHRVYGYDSMSLASITPAENESGTGACVAFTLSASDETAQPLPSQNVDVHLTGPADDVQFCLPPNGSTTKTPDAGGHSAPPTRPRDGAHEVAGDPDTFHVEGWTNSSGDFIFGVQSTTDGLSSLVAWLDRDDDDVLDEGETVDTALMHWVAPTGCTMEGTARADKLSGSPGPDRICGRGGDDVITGLGGDDVILGGAGDDALNGGEGDDSILGGRGRDRILGGDGRDECRGGPGREWLGGCEALRPTNARGRRG